MDKYINIVPIPLINSLIEYNLSIEVCFKDKNSFLNFIMDNNLKSMLQKIKIRKVFYIL